MKFKCGIWVFQESWNFKIFILCLNEEGNKEKIVKNKSRINKRKVKLEKYIIWINKNNKEFLKNLSTYFFRLLILFQLLILIRNTWNQNLKEFKLISLELITY